MNLVSAVLDYVFGAKNVKKPTLSVREQRRRRFDDCDHDYKAVVTVEDSRIVCCHCGHVKKRYPW